MLKKKDEQTENIIDTVCCFKPFPTHLMICNQNPLQIIKNLQRKHVVIGCAVIRNGEMSVLR